MPNNYFQSKIAFGSDLEFTKRYSKYFGYLGIFPCYSQDVSRGMVVFSKCLSSLLLIGFTIEIVSLYFLKIDFFYNRMDIPQIVVDVAEHFTEIFLFLIIFVGAIKDGQSWRLNFEDLMQIDNILKSKGSYMIFHYPFHVFKIVAFILILFTINVASIYYWSPSVLSYLHILHQILFSCIIVIIVFIVDIMGCVRRRYICLNTEITKVFSKYKNLASGNIIENDTTYIKLIYGLLNDTMERVNTLFGLHIIFIISFLFMDLLDTFNWLLFGFYKDSAEVPLIGKIIDLYWEPLIYCVSNHNC